MSNIKRGGKLIGVAALAASTALSGPVTTTAYAGPVAGVASYDTALVRSAPASDGSFRIAQADAAPGDAPEERKRRRKQAGDEAPSKGAGGEEGRGGARKGAAAGDEAPRQRRGKADAAGDGGADAAPKARQADDAPQPKRKPKAAGTADAPAAKGDAEAPAKKRQAAEEKRREKPADREPAAKAAAKGGEAPDGADTQKPKKPGRRQQPEATEAGSAKDGGGSTAEAPKKKAAPQPEARPSNEPVPEKKPGKAEPDAPVPAASPNKRKPAEDTQAGAGDAGARDKAGNRKGRGDAAASDEAAGQRPGERRDRKPAGAEAAGDQPDGRDAPGKARPARQAGEPVDPNAGPANPDLLKQRQDEDGQRRNAEKPREKPAEKPQPVPAATQNQPVEAGKINASDARVQKLREPVKITPITEEQGERIQPPARGDRRADRDRSRRGENGRGDRERRGERGDRDNFDPSRGELPPNVEVVKRDDDGRQILSIVGAAAAGAAAGAAAAYFIKGDDEQRLSRNADDTYYERLPRGRTRQVIVRENGVKVITVTNRYGDIVRRSRVLPNGREVVLFYDPYSSDDERPTYERDPGRDLPPIQVGIPRDEYIVDVDRPDEQLYYKTLVAPPVETVERIYSVDEVVRSERIRDKVRRIDLNTINFDFGSDSIGQDQVGNLEALAKAIQEVVDKNPSETFLIEGHTDAVGSEVANLALSDRRAESVASALTQYFDVPPENLVTQGYGEADLKVNTEEANRENRRVTVRRITPLVKPVQTSGN
ncbi:OmpA family protein [Jiella sonneratiae]|uniref:OmpA family protein n=1 Tax=Jiella sonneratiae TaxID=2816856 RepID=A0ABS3J510_9HYPH|nr:OmpA family protein [Jiella sonneratiae]MBO0904756.1 OmpA family protein [Jiella sonneratiae]